MLVIAVNYRRLIVTYFLFRLSFHGLIDSSYVHLFTALFSSQISHVYGTEIHFLARGTPNEERRA